MTDASAATSDASPYFAQVRRCLQRAYGLIDRDPSSPSYGSADRAFWYYRTIVDSPSAAWQQLMLGFAMLSQHQGLAPTEREQLIRLARATLMRWSAIQHRDGSFDEWYRNERSYCATAFTTAGAAQCLLTLGGVVPNDERDAVLHALERAASWLSRRFHPTVMNQNLAAALGLWCASILLDSSTLRAAAEAHYACLQRQQSSEGWFPEYGGADLGYCTLALDLLAGAHRHGVEEAASMASPLARFIASNVGEGGCLPGRLGSRGTSHCFAFGAEYFAASDANAAQLASIFRRAHGGHRTSGPEDIDDRYFAYFYFPQFALAATARSVALPPAETQALPSADFQHAGFRVTRAAGASIHVSRRLGGAIAVAMRDQQSVYHLGYTVRTRGGNRYATAVWSDTASAEGADGCEADFRRIVDDKPLQTWGPVFSMFTRLLAIPGLASFFSSVVKARMIRGRDRLGGRLTRRLTFRETAVEIEDTILIDRPEQIVALSSQTEIGVHSPSARFEPLQESSGDLAVAEADLETLRTSGRIVLKHLINFAPRWHEEGTTVRRAPQER
jgi:hypothetical protein